MMDSLKIGNGLQVTDVGTSALHMVGYLGKNCNSAEETPDGCCPACKRIGLMRHIRQYHINFEESIFLCENPQCIYPLGSAPLSTIVIPSDAKGYSSQGTCGKRKLFGTNLLTSSIEPCLKLIRTDDLMDTEETSRSDFIPNCNGNNPIRTPSGQSDFSEAKQPTFSDEAESINQKMGLGAQEHSPEVLSVQTQLLSAPEMAPSVSQDLQQSKSSVQEPLRLQWRNTHALCWLDCILSILVHLETLRMLTGLSKNTSVFQNLLTKYNEAAALVNNCQRDELASEVPLDALARAESHLNDIRSTIFLQLQPLLGCKFGEEESPVFAFPLLLRKDRHIENLFLHSFSWKFECLQCGYHSNNSCQQAMTTFTNIIPEWHPLNAVHVAPCNKCNHTSQRRKMVLEKISSVLMVHFVEGLPHNNLMAYSFQFQEYSYQVTAVVQYQKAKHFITWILTSDGIWLECDDLKGSFSRRHHTFEVPSAEIHIVIWERKPPQMTNYLDLQVEETMTAPSKTPVKYSNDETAESVPLTCHKAVDMLNTHIKEVKNLASNQKNNLLHGLGNLSDDDDDVTLNLDSGGQLLEDRAIENKQIVRTGPLQLQELDQKDMCPPTPEGDTQKKSVVLGNTSAPRHEGQPINASNLVTTPSVTLSNGKINFSSKILLPQGAETAVTLVPVEESSNCHPKNPQKKTNETKLGNTKLGTSNVVEFGQEIKINPQISAPSHQNPTFHSPSTNGIKPSVASWVNGLLGKYSSFMPKSAVVPSKPKNCKKSVQKETKSSSLVRQAGHFRGFQTKSSQKSKVATLNSSARTLPTSPLTTFSLANIRVKNLVPARKSEAVTKRTASLDAFPNQDLLKNAHHENQSFISVENTGSFIDKTHQLRVTLLQQLKAKKEKLASLDKLVKAKARHKNSCKKTIKDQTRKQMEPLQTRLLYTQEMQADVWDSKSINSQSTDMSQCSSSNYDDILSELLLSPATTVGSLEFPQEEECRYLEMGGDSSDMPISIGKNNDDLNYLSSLKENGLEDHRNPSALKSPLKKFDFESSAKQDLLDDFFSCSLNSIMTDTEDLHHFDESLLAW
ncbi:SUMO-specific isopeptidase USPL1 isoform X2 [Thamnophis elegans]|uniref:SUMO-specific isopeptidase USPL1 isoform X2 n=1 Tax=Thamnophis elegans TaxID=35005 RepID=UPI0013765734|nr:SUMO-specific isopeptidase USPL1 isoform X2 [Thamnophis elegans]XP_032075396.1 SUMO-specific isopeptidase USPL1 isoform X2 [Thamnophis elegans]XP_032075397.1 SUMO-specific isopeptidase USPL1 isoform X2 [Thamnophis elegans]